MGEHNGWCATQTDTIGKCDCDKGRIRQLEEELDTYRKHEGIVYIFPRWIRKYVDDLKERSG